MLKNDYDDNDNSNDSNLWMVKFFMLMTVLNFNENGEIDQVLSKLDKLDKLDTKTSDNNCTIV